MLILLILMNKQPNSYLKDLKDRKHAKSAHTCAVTEALLPPLSCGKLTLGMFQSHSDLPGIGKRFKR